MIGKPYIIIHTQTHHLKKSIPQPNTITASSFVQASSVTITTAEKRPIPHYEIECGLRWLQKFPQL